MSIADLLRTAHLSVRCAAGVLGVSRSVVHRARLSRQPLESASWFPRESSDSRPRHSRPAIMCSGTACGISSARGRTQLLRDGAPPACAHRPNEERPHATHPARV